MKCNKCGLIYYNNEKFCKVCGSQLSNDVYYQPNQNNIIYNKPFVPKKTNNLGLIIALVLTCIVYIPIIIFIIFVFIMLSSHKTNYTYNHSYKGTYDCRKELSSNNSATFYLGYDNDFKWSKYNDEENNYISGKYTINSTDYGSNYNDSYDYYKSYSIYLDGMEYVVNGNLQLSDINSDFQMEHIIDDGNQQLILYETQNNTKYICKKR